MSSINILDLINVASAVKKPLDAAAKAPQISLDKKDVTKVSSDVINSVTDEVEVAQKEVDATIKNLENKEPWYQSRVIWGTLFTGAFQIASMLGIKTGTIDAESLTNIVMQGVSLAGAAYALYGRLVTNKPIGE